MCKAGVRPHDVSYNTVLKACAREGDVKQTEQWFERRCATGMKPHILSSSSVINACAQQGEVK